MRPSRQAVSKTALVRSRSVALKFGETIGANSKPLPEHHFSRILKGMEVHFTPETEKKLKDLSAQSGRGTDDLVEDAIAGYFDEVQQAREMLDHRYDELKSGRVKPISRDEVIAHFREK